MKNKKIAFNQSEFERHQKMDKELIRCKDSLIELAEQTCGIDKIVDLKKFLNDPAQYLVTLYSSLYLKGRPQHLNEQIFEAETRISIARIIEAKQRFDEASKASGKFAPTINALGVTSNVNEEAFNIYLDPAKADHYNALQTFIDAFRNLKEFSHVGNESHLMRAVPSLLMEGLEVKINFYPFQQR
jgi:hypothetical protein